MPVTARPEPRRGRRRAHHEDRVLRRIDVGEHPADELVDAAQRGQLLEAGLVVGEELGTRSARSRSEPSTSTTPPLLPGPRERLVRGVVVHAHAERRVRVVLEQLVLTGPAGTRPSLPISALTAARWNSGRGSSTIGCAPSPLAMTARGTVGRVERVAERTDGGVVEAFGVLLHELLEPEVHDPPFA